MSMIKLDREARRQASTSRTPMSFKKFFQFSFFLLFDFSNWILFWSNLIQLNRRRSLIHLFSLNLCIFCNPTCVESLITLTGDLNFSFKINNTIANMKLGRPVVGRIIRTSNEMEVKNRMNQTSLKKPVHSGRRNWKRRQQSSVRTNSHSEDWQLLRKWGVGPCISFSLFCWTCFVFFIFKVKNAKK